MYKKIINKISNQVSQLVGKTYYVGGYVRDNLLNIKNNDIDIEVHGIKPEDLYKILKNVGITKTIGKQFGIYYLPEYGIDVAMPRCEKSTGRGHKDFEVYVDPYIGVKKAAERRDFTINSIYKDVKTGEVFDCYGGIKDLKKKIIRHINDKKFVEDPLRVLRACRYAATYNFKIAKETIELCKKIDITSLSKERVEEELLKVLNKSNNPKLFFDNLKQMNQIDYWFKDVNTKYINKAKTYIKYTNNKEAFLLASISVNSNFDISKITLKKEIIKYVKNMQKYFDAKPKTDIEVYELFDNLIDINDYIYLKILSNQKNKYLLDKYKKYKTIVKNKTITGKDLIEHGIKPNANFNKALEYANKLRYQNITKKEILNKTIMYLNTKTKNS